MGRKLYVGNLPFAVGDAELGQIFASAGTVTSARVVLDPATGRKRGFGFVEMSTDAEAENAVNTLNGTDIQGRAMRVDLARERAPREGGGGGGFRRGGPRRDGGGGGGYR